MDPALCGPGPGIAGAGLIISHAVNGGMAGFFYYIAAGGVIHGSH